MAGPNGKAGDVKVGVTGASGFVGRHVVARLRADPSLTCVAAYRTVPASGMDHVEAVAIGDLSADHDWTPLVQACDVVIHVAGLAHARDVSAALIEKVNVEATERLVEAGAAAGISRIVLVSTVKVLGEETRPGRPFTAHDLVAPADPYAAAKAKAEDRLREGTARYGIEHVIVRPPLVYGAGVGANFRSLLRMADTGLPLPSARSTTAAR